MNKDELYENEDFLDLIETYGGCIGIGESDIIEILKELLKEKVA